MSDLATRLRESHRSGRPLVLPNVWDAPTARAFADEGFAALATSSAAQARSLGYDDHEQAPVGEMFAAAARIVGAVDVPVTVDAEAGYGLAPAEFAERLLATGAAGCNLEDTDHPGAGLVPLRDQARRLSEVRRAAPDLVINARVDVFLGGGGGDVAAAVERARAYLDAGADCVYPIMAPEELLGELVERVPGPVNAMWRPGGPSLARLAELGVARISFGAGLYAAMLTGVRGMARRVAAGEDPVPE